MNLINNPLVKRLAYRATVGRLTSARDIAGQYAEAARDLRPWWFVIVPWLAWQARKAYQRELRAALLERAEVRK